LHLHLVSRLRMGEAIPPLSLCLQGRDTEKFTLPPSFSLPPPLPIVEYTYLTQDWKQWQVHEPYALQLHKRWGYF
jgi:hypothetical protein